MDRKCYNFDIRSEGALHSTYFFGTKHIVLVVMDENSGEIGAYVKAKSSENCEEEDSHDIGKGNSRLKKNATLPFLCKME